jgi:hypothetical protein
MIDLRKPLEGAPGLLLMAALILLGATIGIGVAIVVKWIEMGDALANFLGGVVGAGLGAVLAIGGAVYVQRRDRRDAQSGPANEFIMGLEELRARILMVQFALERPPDNYIEAVAHEQRTVDAVVGLTGAIEGIPYPYQLGRAICKQVQGCKLAAAIDIRNAVELVTYPAAGPIEERHQEAASSLGEVVTRMDRLLQRLRAVYAD